MNQDIHSNSVATFFDNHSSTYSSKYGDNTKFYTYFFYERLNKSTQGFEFHNSRILDVGSGTGALYDYLLEKRHSIKEFVATDISTGMLEESNVPPKNKYIGELQDVQFDGKTFDYVFMLGVTTYLSPENTKQQLKKISNLLDEDGILIITYTNKHSIDIIIRNLLSPIARFFSSKNRIISQSFSTFYYGPEFKKLLPKNLELIQKFGLNHTVFPFSRLLPGLSVWLARKIHVLKESKIKYFLSSDILIVCKKR